VKPYRFEIHKSGGLAKGGVYYWRCRAPNGRIVADGSEGYKTAAGCRRALNKFRTMMPGEVL
jgi:uncharacterized protein YegP (UPF0339 family)